MAISFITGVPRSGKSYYVVYLLYLMYKPELHKINFFKQWWRYYVKPLKPKFQYDFVYTNINEFNFDYDKRIKKLDFDVLVRNLTKLHRLNVDLKKSDEELNILARELGLFNCLIVVDEAAHYFTKPINPVLIWWLTYHGHMHQEIYIITQHVDMIPNDYLMNGEFFYKVYPPSKAFFSKKFSIGLYSCIKFYQNCKTKVFHIPFESDVAKLYVSGKAVNNELLLKKFYYIFAALFVFGAFAFYNFTKSPLAGVTDHDNNHSIKSSVSDLNSSNAVLSNSSISVPSSLENTFIEFFCIYDNCYSSKYKSVPISFILYLQDHYKSDYSHKKIVNFNYRVYDFLLDKSSIDLLDRSFSSSVSDQQTSFNPISTNSLMGGVK